MILTYDTWGYFAGQSNELRSRRSVFTVRKWSCGKVMFSQACVSHSVHTVGIVHPRIHLGRGCVSEYALGQGVWTGCVCVCLWMGCVKGCTPPETSTEVDSTHPTGKHSCSRLRLWRFSWWIEYVCKVQFPALNYSNFTHVCGAYK